MKTKDFPVVQELKQIAKSKMAFYNDMMDEKEMTGSKLLHVTGNLIDIAEEGEFDVIVQGCNCFNTMGGGIAREIRERYPKCAAVDAATVRGDYTKLGNWTQYDTGKFHIINAYTQFDMSNGTDVFEYTAFGLILKKLLFIMPFARFGFPHIGMGLANGDKDSIMSHLEWFAMDIHDAGKGGSVTLVKFQ